MSDDRERELTRLAPQLGAEAAERIDPVRVTDSVLARLRARTSARPGWRRARLVPIAAAAIVVLAVGLGVRELTQPSDDELAATVPVELQELALVELSEVLDSLHLEAPVAELVAVGLYDLDESELSRLLESMEG